MMDRIGRLATALCVSAASAGADPVYLYYCPVLEAKYDSNSNMLQIRWVADNSTDHDKGYVQSGDICNEALSWCSRIKLAGHEWFIIYPEIPPKQGESLSVLFDTAGADKCKAVVDYI